MLAGIVPANTIRNAKTRLNLPLGPSTKERFIVLMLRAVLRSMLDSRLDATYFVSSDPVLKAEAKGMGAVIVREKVRTGANAAVAMGNQMASEDGALGTLVMFSDIPRVMRTDVDEIISLAGGSPRCVVATPSVRGGTNALWRSPPEIIRTKYGENSFINHKRECEVAGVLFKEFRCDRISLDIDTPEDLDLLLKRKDSFEYSFLSKHL